MRISDWSSDVCSSDLPAAPAAPSPFDAKLGFDRFIVARSNILAANAARRMAMEEAPQFNPLYLCSGTGQGKTHLLHAIAQAYAAAHPTDRKSTRLNSSH